MAGTEKLKEQIEKGFYDYKGVRFNMMLIPPGNLEAMATFEVRPDDIFLVTYPKCGTHWSSEIINLILTGGDPDKIDHTRQEAALEMSYIKDKSNLGNPNSLEPWYKKLESLEGRRVILTHLNDFLLPPQMFTKKSKVIYVTRNPKDCGVSLYHATSGIFGDRGWNTFADEWIEQKDLLMGGFFEHVLAFWKRRHESNVLYMKYEDMKKDPRGSIIKFADHLECPLTEKQLDDVVHHSEVKNMKKTYDKVEEKTPGGKFLTKAMGKSPFIRKGQIGDWKNHFTVAQNERMDDVIKEKLHGTGLTFDFE